MLTTKERQAVKVRIAARKQAWAEAAYIQKCIERREQERADIINWIG